MERITAAGNGAPQRFMTLAESAMAGNAEAKAEIESFFDMKVTSMRDLYAVMNAAAELMTKSEIARAENVLRIARALDVTVEELIG